MLVLDVARRAAFLNEQVEMELRALQSARAQRDLPLRVMGSVHNVYLVHFPPEGWLHAFLVRHVQYQKELQLAARHVPMDCNPTQAKPFASVVREVHLVQVVDLVGAAQLVPSVPSSDQRHVLRALPERFLHKDQKYVAYAVQMKSQTLISLGVSQRNFARRGLKTREATVPNVVRVPFPEAMEKNVLPVALEHSAHRDNNHALLVLVDQSPR